MLQELVRGYKGLQDYKINNDNRSALVHFTRHEDAKIALAGKYFLSNYHFNRIEQIQGGQRGT